MFGILRNGEKILSHSTGARRSYIAADGSVLLRTIWQDLDECIDPYMDSSKWNVHSRILDLQRIYKNDNLELFEFTQEKLEELSFRKLRGY